MCQIMLFSLSHDRSRLNLLFQKHGACFVMFGEYCQVHFYTFGVEAVDTEGLKPLAGDQHACLFM
jgi:hypothetical protein